MYEHISVADGFERLARKQAVLSLGLLKAKDLGGPFRDQPPYIVHPEADRVDVPSDEAHGYGRSERFVPGPGPSTSSTKHRRPVGGEDRAPTCQKRLGETRPTGETGPFERGFAALSASEASRWGA